MMMLVLVEVLVLLAVDYENLDEVFRNEDL
jgi:hypothetical protein